MIAQWKEKYSERLDELRERGRAWWLGLAPREKIILSSLAGVVGVLLLALIFKESTVLVNQVSQQAGANYKNMERIQTWVAELRQQRIPLSRYERLRSRRGEDFDLQSFIENEAKRFTLTLAKSAPTRALGASSSDKTTKADTKADQEEWLEVELKDGALENLVKFMAGIEDTLGLRLVDISLKTQFQDPTKIDATLVVASKKKL